jgi:sortase A
MRRASRVLGTLMILGGLLTLGWAVLVWQWQDPFTWVYTHRQQSRLSAQLDRELARFQPAASPARSDSLAAVRREVAGEATRYRKTVRRGEAIGRLTIGRIGLKIVLVDGTDHESLKKGPGLYDQSAVPGQGQLVYVAGHRTTYLAPFAHIDELRPGDFLTIEMPYATFKYAVTQHRVVAADDLAVLRSHHREVLILQACHPRFFATHRYLVYAKPVAIIPRGGPAYPLDGSRLALGGRGYRSAR